ncbi:MAG: hypothetical protein M1396_07045 [Chloroflexi bacterium]|nr:hypothetical protein [Chloroflexota bacterium]
MSVTILAAIPRFALFDRIEFKFDEASVAHLALRFIEGRGVPTTSILTSGGLHNSPLFVYLVAPALLLSYSPLLITGWITLWNVLAAPLLLMVLSRLLPLRYALMSALLYAINPVAVHYSRKIWAPDLMSFFTVLLFAGLCLALLRQKMSWLVVAGLCYSVLVQLHPAAIPSGLSLLVAGLLWVLHQRRRPFVAVGGVVGMIAGMLLPAVPFGVYEWQHHFIDVGGAVHQVLGRTVWTAEPWLAAWWLAAGWDLSLFFGPLALQAHLPLIDLSVFDVFVLLLLVIGAGAALWWIFRGLYRGDSSAFERSDQRVARPITGAMVFLIVVPPLAVASRSAVAVFPHYLVFLEPLLMLLLVIGVFVIAPLSVSVSRRLRATPLLVGAVLGGVIAVVYGARGVLFDEALAHHKTGGDYGVPVIYSLRAAQAVAGASRSFVVPNNGDTRAVFAYFDVAGLVPPVIPLDTPPTLVLPKGSARYIFDPGASRRKKVVRQMHAREFAVGPYTILLLPPQAQRVALGALEGGQVVRGPFTLQDGVTLKEAAIQFLPSQRRVRVMLDWYVTGTAVERLSRLKWFVHLYDTHRHTVAEADGLGVANGDLQVGDTVLLWLDAPFRTSLAPGTYTLVTGLYEVRGFHVLQVRGPHGEKLGGEIPLGSFTIH